LQKNNRAKTLFELGEELLGGAVVDAVLEREVRREETRAQQREKQLTQKSR
jgi:hypothetical protein